VTSQNDLLADYSLNTPRDLRLIGVFLVTWLILEAIPTITATKLQTSFVSSAKARSSVSMVQSVLLVRILVYSGTAQELPTLVVS
jgi:hypothetical protein